MRAAILAKDTPQARAEAAEVEGPLKRLGAVVERVRDAEDAKGDIVLVVGDSTFVLDAFGRLATDAPVLSIGSGGAAFLSEVTAAQFPSLAKRLFAGDYRVEDVDRMECLLGGKAVGTALNEAALLAATTGKFVRYSLFLDGELVYRDRGDGVIIATPTGSTAYALSAGGPVLLPGTGVFSIVPVCSEDGNKPVVAPLETRIGVTDLDSPGGVELVLDGRARFRAGSAGVEIRRAKQPARFVRFAAKRYAPLFGKLKLKKELSRSLDEAPPSAKFVFKLLEYEGPLTQKEIVRESALSARTVRNALAWLATHGFVGKAASLRDLRQEVYDLAERLG